MSKPMDHILMDQLFKDVNSYFKSFNDNIDPSNAKEAVDTYLINYSNWKNIVGQIFRTKNEDGFVDGELEYGNVLVLFSVAVSYIKPQMKGTIEILEEEVKEYEKNVKHMPTVKLALYYNLGLCWHELGSEYDTKVLSNKLCHVVI